MPTPKRTETFKLFSCYFLKFHQEWKFCVPIWKMSNELWMNFSLPNRPLENPKILVCIGSGDWKFIDKFEMRLCIMHLPPTFCLFLCFELSVIESYGISLRFVRIDKWFIIRVLARVNCIIKFSFENAQLETYLDLLRVFFDIFERWQSWMWCSLHSRTLWVCQTRVFASNSSINFCVRLEL